MYHVTLGKHHSSWRWPQKNEDNLKIEEDLKNEDDYRITVVLKIKDDLKNKDDLNLKTT